MASITDQYRIIVSGAAWIDRSARGRLRFEGRDVLAFLQALVSNDVATLKPGDGAYATYLTPQGRMIADLDVHVEEDSVMAGVVSELAPALATRFDQLIFSEDVRVADVSEQTMELGVVGGDAPGAIARALSLDAGALAGLREPGHLAWREGFIARSGGASLPAFTIIAHADRRQSIVDSLVLAGVAEMSFELEEGLRVETGRPLFGVDMNTNTIPLEAGLLDRAISTTKGCYVGQEIVIRILHRGGGRVARRLVRLALDEADVLPPAGLALAEGDRELGELTSVARSPITGMPIALGYVHRDFALLDRELRVANGSGARVTGFAQ